MCPNWCLWLLVIILVFLATFLAKIWHGVLLLHLRGDTPLTIRKPCCAVVFSASLALFLGFIEVFFLACLVPTLGAATPSFLLSSVQSGARVYWGARWHFYLLLRSMRACTVSVSSKTSVPFSYVWVSKEKLNQGSDLLFLYFKSLWTSWTPQRQTFRPEQLLWLYRRRKRSLAWVLGRRLGGIAGWLLLLRMGRGRWCRPVVFVSFL